MRVKKAGYIKTLYLLCVLPAFLASGQAQTGGRKQPESDAQVVVGNYQLDSKLMARKMPYQVIFPTNYKKKKKARFPVVYLLHGLGGRFDNWTTQSDLKKYAARYNYIFVMPEGETGWYCDSVSSSNNNYESYIIKELIPEIDKNFRTLPELRHRAIAGFSMGGYGSLKFGLKYPEKFVLAGSFSGSLNAADFTGKYSGDAIGKMIDVILGEEKSEARKANDIYRIIKETTDENAKNLPFIYLDCGTEDFLLKTNRNYAALLTEKKIPHEYRQLPGKHDWKFWNSQLAEFLRLSRIFLK
jgi:putative tributyrin esterase